MPRKVLPKVTVLDRRLANPFGSPGVAITLKTPGAWEVRTINSEVRRGRMHDIIHNKGWTFVAPEELDGTPDEYGFMARDGHLVRGDRGEEVLMKIAARDYAQIQDAKARLNTQALGKAALRDTVGTQAAAVGGDEGAAQAARQFDGMQITDTREPVEAES